MLNWLKKNKKKNNSSFANSELSERHFTRNDSISYMIKKPKRVSKMNDTYDNTEYIEEEEEQDTEFGNQNILAELNNTRDKVEYLSNYLILKQTKRYQVNMKLVKVKMNWRL